MLKEANEFTEREKSVLKSQRQQVSSRLAEKQQFKEGIDKIVNNNVLVHETTEYDFSEGGSVPSRKTISQTSVYGRKNSSKMYKDEFEVKA